MFCMRAFGDSYVPQATSLYSAGEGHVILPYEESPMGAAAGIAFEEVRARKPWDALRGQLQARFDPWLDGLAAQLQEPAPTWAQVAETVWNLRQELTGGWTEPSVAHAPRGESTRQQRRWPQG